MKHLKNLFLALLTITFIACSNDDDNAPELSVSLEFDTYRTGFYAAGATDAVVVMKGETDVTDAATISLGAEISNEITYNLLTNRIEWTNLLPLGDHVVTIVATVDGEEATTDITIENRFEGNFSGGYNFDPTDTESLTSLNFEAEFVSVDNLVNIDDEGNSSSGTWSLEGNTLTLIFTYDDVNYFTYQGDIVYNGVEAYVDGMWYNGQEAEVGMEQGYFRIDFLEI